MNNQEYIEKIDELFTTILDIRTDILMMSLMETAHNYQLSDFSEDVISEYKNRYLCFLRQHQSELDFESVNLKKTLDGMIKDMPEESEKVS